MKKSAWRIACGSIDRLGEGPQWSSQTGELFWVDFYGPTVHRLSPDGTARDWRLPQFESLGSLVLCEGGSLLLATDKGLFLFNPANNAVAPFSDPNQNRAGVSYNDSKVDRNNRLWVGTFDRAESEPRGILYVVDAEGGWRVGDSGFTVCNGPAFSPAGDIIYFNDSVGHQTLAYDLDKATGALTNRRVFYRYAEADGLPDGLCVDAEGHVWCALYGGGSIVRLSPDGDEVERLGVPTPNVTSCCFGGPDMKTLFATTGFSSSDPSGGRLLAMNVEIAGLAEPCFKLSPRLPIRG